MNLGENIHDAFEIVAKTYENIYKFMDFCRTAASEKGEFKQATPKFLRYRSDTDVSGWYISSFVLLFQSENDPLLENKWRDGPIYVMEINLYLLDVYDVPTVNIAKYEYEDIASWAEGCSPADHWIFVTPLYLEIEYEYDGEMYFGKIADTEYADRRYWGLRRITGFEFLLTEITNNNAYEKVFGNFHVLAYK